MPTFELHWTQYKAERVKAVVEAESEDLAWAALDDETAGRVVDIHTEDGDVVSRFGTSKHSAYQLDE
jgi:hypothetical protein